MVKFSDSGKGYRGDPRGHSENARGIRHSKVKRVIINGQVFIKKGKKYYNTLGQKVDITKRYIRYRQKDPSRFQKGSFRTIDPGRPGHTKVVIGKLKGKTTTTTQAILIPKEDIRKLITCPNCGGLGKEMRLGFPSSKTCSRCQGVGRVYV